jgi:hypothetical protein
MTGAGGAIVGSAVGALVGATVGGKVAVDAVVGATVGTLGAIGTTAADEHAANNIKLQLKTTIRFNMVSSPGHHQVAAFVICVLRA